MKLDFNSSSLRDQIQKRLQTLQDNPHKLTMWGIRLGLVMVVGVSLVWLIRPRSPQVSSAPAANPTRPQTDAAAEASPPPNAPFGAMPAQDPFQTAVDFAELAGQRASTAKTATEWQQVASTWDRAVRAMIAVPPKHPRYDEATEKAIEYRRNFSLVQRKADQVIAQDRSNSTGQISPRELVSPNPQSILQSPSVSPPSSVVAASPSIDPTQQFMLASQLLDPDGRAIVEIKRVTDQMIQVTMSDEWQAQSYEARLLAARRLWETWAKAYSPNQPDRAFLRLINTQGKRIGGSGLEGSAINVIYE